MIPNNVLFYTMLYRNLVKTSSERTCVHQEGARPHLLDGELVNEMVVVFVEGAVQRDAVGLKEQVLQSVYPRQPQALLDAVGQVGIVEDDVEAEGLRPQGHRRTDPAEPDDAERVTAYPGAPLCRLSHLKATFAKLNYLHKLFNGIIF